MVYYPYTLAKLLKGAVVLEPKLFPNLKKLTTIFSIAILVITVGVLLLRLTVFTNPTLRVPPPEGEGEGEPAAEGEEEPIGALIDFEMGDRIIFDTASANGSLKIKFPQENDLNIRFKIIRKDNERELYSSKIISPGERSINVKLAKNDLDKGEYPCTAQITTFNASTDQRIDSFEQDMLIIVKNAPIEN